MGLLTTALVFLLTAAGVWVWLSVRRVKKYWADNCIPTISQTWMNILGMDAVLMRESAGEAYARLYRDLDGHPLGGFLVLGQEMIMIRDPGILSQVMVQDFEAFQDRGMPTDVEADPLEGHLFSMSGASWRTLRYKLSPAFTAKKLMKMAGLVDDCANSLVEALRDVVKEGDNSATYNMSNWLSRFTTDVIGSAAFGLDVGAVKDEDSHFLKMTDAALRVTPLKMLVFIGRLICPSLLSLFKIRTVPKKVNDFFMSTTSQMLKEREESGRPREDFVQLLLQLKQKGSIEFDQGQQDEDMELVRGLGKEEDEPTKIEFTDSVLAAQAFVFFVAGHETTASGLGFALFLLSTRQEVQARIRKEVEDVTAKLGRGLDYQSLKQMTFLDACVSETLRLFPPLAFLNRECKRDISLVGGQVIRRGTPLLVSLAGLHRDPKYFPDPDTFLPTRFLPVEQGGQTILPFTYMPFGDGPRMCIGKRFALLEMKLGLAKILQNFVVFNCDKMDATGTDVPMDKTSVISRPKTGFWFILEKIDKTPVS